MNLNPSNFCIIGDLNCRIGEEQSIDKNELAHLGNVYHRRNSMDKTINWQGKKLLEAVESIGGIVMNGRCSDDIQGNYSFCGVMGNSVIDYSIASISFLNYLDSFSIPSKPFSDHMPILVKLKIPKNVINFVPSQSLKKLYWCPKTCDLYRNNLSLATRSQPIHRNASVDEMIESITTKIKSAHITVSNRSIFTPKQKWFDWKCFRLRSVMSKCLREFRKSYTNINKFNYLSARTKYLNTCSQKKLDFQNANITKLDNVRCSKAWWRIANTLKSRTPLAGNEVSSDSLYNHFSSLLAIETDQSINWCMPYIVDSFLDSPFEQCELFTVLKSVKLNKSPGLDGIPYEFYKFAPVCFLNEILQVFNTIFLSESIPVSFKKSMLIPLFKKGDPSLAANYRGLSLIDCIAKIFNNVLLNRIESWLSRNDILNEYQAGFRKQYSTIDNIFNLVNIVTLNNLKSKHTYAFFVDFSCAFDKIPRNSLFYKLSVFGLSSKMIRIIQHLYDDSCSRIWDGSILSDEFKVKTGVKQGCILSPILFSLYLNDLPFALPGGLNFDNTSVKILLYADDIVLLADTPEVLQEMIDALYNYCNQWSLCVNLLKSKILIFRKSPRISQSLQWHFGSEIIEIVNSYTYLGVNLNFNMSFKKHLENKLSASKIAITSTWSRYISNVKISSKNKFKIFESASQSIMLYAAQVWGFERYDSVEKLLRFFVKKLHYLPSNTPNYMINLETGVDPLFLTTLKLHFDYINRALSLSPSRLPNILALKIIDLNVSWAKEWKNLCALLNYTPQDSSLPICKYSRDILQLLQSHEYAANINKASNSQFHDLYNKLEYNVPPLLAQLSPRASSLIIRARGGLLNINARSFIINTDGICTLCNMNEVENIFHFIGICPVFSNFRITYFQQDILELADVIDILNGKAYKSLYLYIESCLNYRKLIISEFEI